MRNRRKLRRYIITYDIVMTVLALISIGLVIFDLVGLISIEGDLQSDRSVYNAHFAIDYAIRFSLAPRSDFVKTHVLTCWLLFPIMKSLLSSVFQGWDALPDWPNSHA
ncbi:MAG: hypothetical protein ACLS36_00660 [Streptococcus sp.]